MQFYPTTAVEQRHASASPAKFFLKSTYEFAAGLALFSVVFNFASPESPFTAHPGRLLSFVGFWSIAMSTLKLWSARRAHARPRGRVMRSAPET